MMNATDHTEDHLKALNDQYALENIPAMAFLTFLMMVGLLGNSLVFYVYLTKMKSSTTRYFILTLSILDLITSSVCITIDIVDLRYNFTFGEIGVVPCKLSAFVVTFTTYSSVNVLIAVAAVRHKLVCYPNGKQTSAAMAKVAIGLSCVVGVLFASPSALLYGGQNKNVTESINSTLCTISDDYVGTIYPLVDNGWQFLTFLAANVTLAVLYIRVWKKVSLFAGTKRWSLKLEEESSGASDSMSVSQSKTSTSVKGTFEGKSITRLYPSRRQVSARRTTLMLFMITLTFTLSYLPSLALMIARGVHWEVMENLKGPSLALYNLFLRSYFVNCAVNPLVYGYFDRRVRREILFLLRLKCF